MTPDADIIQAYLTAHNTGVRTGDFAALIALFDPDAQMHFDGVSVGPFIGRAVIAEAFANRGPTDELILRSACPADDDTIDAEYEWRDRPSVAAGTITFRVAANRIRRLTVRPRP